MTHATAKSMHRTFVEYVICLFLALQVAHAIHLLHFLLNDKVRNVERMCDAMLPEDECFQFVDVVSVIAKQKKEDDFIFEYPSTCTYLRISETNFSPQYASLYF